jgi:hypothetical protein
VPRHRCVHAGPEEGCILLDATRAWGLVRALLAFVEEVPEAAPHAALTAAAHAAQVGKACGACVCALCVCVQLVSPALLPVLHR